jgi:hypothetical protein
MRSLRRKGRMARSYSRKPAQRRTSQRSHLADRPIERRMVDARSARRGSGCCRGWRCSGWRRGHSRRRGDCAGVESNGSRPGSDRPCRDPRYSRCGSRVRPLASRRLHARRHTRAVRDVRGSRRACPDAPRRVRCVGREGWDGRVGGRPAAARPAQSPAGSRGRSAARRVCARPVGVLPLEARSRHGFGGRTGLTESG